MQENKNRIIIKKHWIFFRFPSRIGKVIRATGVFFIVFFSVFAITCFAQAATKSELGREVLNTSLEEFIIKSKFSTQNFGVLIANVDNDSVLTSLYPDTLLNPASVAKLLTTAIAFDKLGMKYSFKTSVFFDSAFDSESGRCLGNMFIKGGGDPSLVVERLWLFVQHLRCIGVKSIEKDIVLDDSFFDSVLIGPGFIEDSSDDPYMAPIGALSANFNCVSVWLRPGSVAGNLAYADILPKASTIQFSSTAKTSTGKGSDWAITSRNGKSHTNVRISGTIGADAKQVVEYRKVWQTWEYFGEVFRNLLEENNIACKGVLRHGTVPINVMQKKPFYVFPSIPLSDIATDMMKYSSNYAAEMVFKTLSAENDSCSGSWEKSSQIVASWWKEKKLVSLPKIMNGSGMGNTNRMSCRQIVDLLSYMYRQKMVFPEYLYAFPVAGIDGTLRSRFKNSRFKGILRGKTGTLNDYGVNTIAGYIFLTNKTYAFAILVNGYKGNRQYSVHEMQEKILDLVIP